MLESPGLRPTPDRVRETLFNWIQFDIEQRYCLDLFAGSGALGFEALSRGAAQCVFVESSPELVKQLETTANRFNSLHHSIHLADALSWLQNCQQTFDIIFLDPPFHQDLIMQCLLTIKKHKLLNDNGMIYIEAEKKFVLTDDWQMMKNKRAGQVQSMLLRQQQ